jgi:hypothetical protein
MKFMIARAGASMADLINFNLLFLLAITISIKYYFA